MNSGAHRGVTVVTVLTLIFAPVLKHGNQWVLRLVGQTRETHVQTCVQGQPCPYRDRVVNTVTLPAPPSGPPIGDPPGGLGNPGSANSQVTH